MARKSEIFLKDYKKPDYLIEQVELDIHITQRTSVQAKLWIKKNSVEKANLFLNGKGLSPLGFKVDGKELSDGEYKLCDEGVTIFTDKERFVFESLVEIDPDSNLSCEGLYKSGQIYCTQNEAQGFRKITYFMDRPDVMARFKTTLRGDAKRYPVLLANGNKTEEFVDEKGIKTVVWDDPYPKPCYLFAVVAGDLAKVSDTYTTLSGRNVELEIYVDHGNEDKCEHAMRSLKNSMKWDEEKFGLEYDLDIYMIVAVDSFNMGAMENKGLNIFNSAYVLAKKETATDADFAGIESVIGHEYFHNWTGNRVTCRDWFQLTLKEGLTVFRDQEFSADMLSRPVQRIKDVASLRSRQFPEDQGPMAHPIRPTSYIEINNFYTATVYEKGAEVIRMIHSLLGEEMFRKGMDLYFQRHDGQAVTTADFVQSMQDASSKDLSQFQKWYDQVGTPTLNVTWEYSAKDKRLQLKITQESKQSADLLPLHMPFHIGIIDSITGTELPVEGKLELKKKEELFIFENIANTPILSLNRGFSAPVILKAGYTQTELIRLMACDSDEFSRYEAAQQLSMNELKNICHALESGQDYALNEQFLKAFGLILNDKSLDEAFSSCALTLPSVERLDEEFDIYKVEIAQKAHDQLCSTLAMEFYDDFLALYKRLDSAGEYELGAQDMGRRSLRQTCLSYLSYLANEDLRHFMYEEFERSGNMTEELGTLKALVSHKDELAQKASEKFYTKWQHETLVIQKWFAAHASRKDITVLELVELEKRAAYDKKVPNLIRSLVGSFAQNNHVVFNAPDGSGYRYLADKVLEIDKYNPQVASRLAKSLNHLKRLDERRAKLLRHELQRLVEAELSSDTYEVVSKNLA